MRALLSRVCLSGWFMVAAEAASAHHPTGGQVPQTAIQGLLSGLAHPVIGIDHLAFVVGVGILAAYVRRGGWMPVAFLAASGLGVAAHLRGIDIPAGEVWLALSLAMMALAVFLRQRTGPTLATALCALGGLAHGHLLAESIVGAEPAPLSSYLVGLFLIQLAVALGAATLVRWVGERRPQVTQRAVAVAAALTLAIGLASALGSV
jgi:urease accessory protein